jgi:hypothetical protein
LAWESPVELDAAIVEIDRQLDALIGGMEQAGRFRLLIAWLCKIPGVSKLAAISILAESGIDMSRFRTAAHLAARAGRCPGQNQSAANANPRGCAMERGGLKPCWCRARGPPGGRRTATTRRSSIACPHGTGGRRRRSVQSPHRS